LQLTPRKNEIINLRLLKGDCTSRLGFPLITDTWGEVASASGPDTDPAVRCEGEDLKMGQSVSYDYGISEEKAHRRFYEESGDRRLIWGKWSK